LETYGFLTLAFGNCEICKIGKLPFTSQEAQTTCLKCGKRYKVCIDCKQKGCPNCGGNFSPRPIRPKHGLVNNPASTTRVPNKKGC